MHPLDNPIWHALSGPQATVAERGELAARYQPAVAPFAAVPDDAGAPAWEELRALVGPAGIAVVCRDPLSAPTGWEQAARFPCRQMWLPATDGAPGRAAGSDDLPSDVWVETLGEADVDEMLDLVERTQPGPFARRTIELGTYLGIRRHGTLVAMAGERMRLPGYTEISAVCTDPRQRGRGLAAALMRALAHLIAMHGNVAFLHVVQENAGAIRLYDALGFTTRRHIDAVALQAPA